MSEKMTQDRELAAPRSVPGSGPIRRALQRLRQSEIRYVLFPYGTRRERFGKWCMHVQRRFRYHARQGAGALVRALGRRIRRMLRPERVRRATTPLRACREMSGTASAMQVPGLVSVVLPVYNQADLLRDSIESVLAQTHRAFELILVNDGSTDGVAAVLEQYARHLQVRILTQVNQKLPRALSNGFEVARGEFWTWTSADNLMEPRQLERQVAFLRAHPDVALVYCDYLAIDDRGEPLRDPNFRPQNRRTPDSPVINLPRSTADLNTTEDNFIGACFLYRGWVGRLLGEYAPSIGIEDYDYWMRLNALFKVAHLGTDEPLYRYRVHDNTLCARAGELRILERVQQLMTLERTRAAYFARPWTICADAPTQAWLAGVNTGRHTVRGLPERTGREEHGEKRLYLVRAETLPALAERPPHHADCVAVWFDPDERAPYRYFSEVQRVADVCFAADGATAARLALSTRRVFHIPPGPSLPALAVAFANNHSFFAQTTPAADRVRTLPQVYRPADRKLRVLLQVDNFVQGGFEQVVLDLLAVLDPRRFDVAILVLGEEGAAAGKARKLGFTVLRLPAGNRQAAYRQLLRERQVELINAHYSVFGAALAAELKIPFIQTVHSTYIWLTDEQIAEHQQADADTTAYFCVSAAAAEYADLRFGFSPTKMVIVPNGIDVQPLAAARAALQRDEERQRLGFGPEDFVFLLTASIYPPKGQLLLVQALAAAIQDQPHIKVALLGRPMDERYTRAVHLEVERRGLEQAVRFLGYHASAARFYPLCDAFVLPSFCEGWSLALAEALCAGLPVIATDVGSARDLLSRTGGHLLRSPAGAIVDLDLNGLYRSLDARHPEFVAELADALRAVAASPAPPVLPDALRRSLDRRQAYRAYEQIFDWIAAGGDPAAARPWVWELHDVYARCAPA